MSRIDSVDKLRAVLGQPREATKAKVLDRLDEQASEFVRTSAFCVLSTVGADGTVEASPKGDEPGFVRIEDERTLLMPERPGNNLAFGLQNIVATGKVGLIFLKPRTGETLRVTGRAEIFDDADSKSSTTPTCAKNSARPSGRRCWRSASMSSAASSTAPALFCARKCGSRRAGRRRAG